ncbi:MAG: phytanoyl-CoA dioxygenase [Candidatus Latescibacteria bacterium]|nr:phytanoyl-CoA dioxygenase [Candidatus Latescibacterota bacterium]
MTSEAQPNWAVLTDEQRDFFDANGYLLIENALPDSLVKELDNAIDELYNDDNLKNHFRNENELNLRNCIAHHPSILQLLDWPTTAPLAWQILNWNIQMITSHLIVIPSGPEPPEEDKRKGGWHRDGGTSPREMTEPHPRIMLKIAYIISDQTDPASGATKIVPGSNRMWGRPPTDPETGHLRGAISLNHKPGTAIIFEQRTYHTVSKNWAGHPRKTIFMGYGYRWVKPMDYISMPDELIERCNPIQKQLLGVVSAPISYYIPRDEDVPLRGILEASE